MIHENTYKKVVFRGIKGLVFLGDKIITYQRDDKTTYFPFRIDLPGGGREGDESPFETFKREVQEEFGIVIEQGDIKFSCTIRDFINPNIISYFIVTKSLKYDANDVVFGNEGIKWSLMTPSEFLDRCDTIERQRDMVKKYLNGEMMSEL